MKLTIEEFSMLREAMYCCKQADLNKNPSAFQAKPFFNNEENFKRVEEKLGYFLTNKPVETTNEQPNLEIEYYPEYHDFITSKVCIKADPFKDYREQAFKHFKDLGIKINGIVDVKRIG
jgi:hypothetical protein